MEYSLVKYLLTKDLFNRDKYFELKVGQEVKLTRLIREKRLPEHFTLNGEAVIASEIIGFTDDKPEEPKQDLGIRSMDDLREWAKTQKWYKRKPGEQKLPEQPEPITLLP